MDEAIAAMFKKENNMLIGDRAAEDLKLDLGGAIVRQDDARRALVRGRDMVTSLPMTVEVSAIKIGEALQGPIAEIVASIKWVLERTPPELAGDVMRSGIYLTGGIAQLPDLDHLIASELGIAVSVARNPSESVILGAGHLADNIELLDSIGKGRRDARLRTSGKGVFYGEVKKRTPRLDQIPARRICHPAGAGDGVRHLYAIRGQGKPG